MALLEIKVAASMLARHFEVTRVGSADDVIEVSDFTMHPGGLRVRLRPRAR